MVLLFKTCIDLLEQRVINNWKKQHVYELELKIEILLLSFTNLISTLKHPVPTYNTDWNDNVN